MTTLEMVKNAEKAMKRGFAEHTEFLKAVYARAEAEGRYYYDEGAMVHIFTKEEQRANIEININNTELYQEWKRLKNQRAREMRGARVEG